jgi:hypothetical protein
MILLSIFCKSVFDDDKKKYISNIVVSSIVLAVGVIGNIIYSALLATKNVNYICKN